jgi:hypothetical protein
MSIFQQSVAGSNKNYRGDMSYDNQFFLCPTVYAKDGFYVSLQIHNGNYCSSENGYRKLGHTWERVEFGFPSEDDVLLHEYSESFGFKKESAVGTVGSIPVSVLEELFAKRGGIDWEKTISVEEYESQNFLDTKK